MPAVDKRRRIVETAYRLFARDGYHATGIDRIIAEAGVAKMTMYRHFPAKDDLIAQVLSWREHLFAERLSRLAGQGATPAEKIGRIVDLYEAWFRAPHFTGCLFAHALAEFGDPGHPVFAAAARQKQAFKGHLAALLADVSGAKDAAAALFAAFEGATLLAQMGQVEEAVGALRRTAPLLVAGR